jgi:AmiR/NasT family two-component response regulator
MPRDTVLPIVTGIKEPKLRTVVKLARELRVSLEAIARACEQAWEREDRRKAVERARRDAMRLP